MATLKLNPNVFKQMDYGAAVQSGQQIKMNALEQKSVGMTVQQQQDSLRGRQKANEIRSQIDGMPEQIDALEDEGLFEQADKMRDSYIKTRKQEVELIGAMREGIDADNYDMVRQGMLEEGTLVPGLWPETYSDDWFRKMEKDSKGNITKLTRKWAANGAVLSQDLVQQDGEIIWQGAAYDADKAKAGGKGGGKGFEFKASDTNAIARQSERIFGGSYNPATGKFSGLDKEKTSKIAALQAEAEKIYSDGQGQVSHGVAVAQAARKLRIDVENVRETQKVDPFSLFPPAQ